MMATGLMLPCTGPAAVRGRGHAFGSQAVAVSGLRLRHRRAGQRPAIVSCGRLFALAVAAPPSPGEVATETVTVADPFATPPEEKLIGEANWGDTSGAVLVVEGATVTVGARDLMTGVDWSLLPNQRVGLVGPNGAGKSTLLRAIAGRGDVLHKGRVILKRGCRLGYLEQTAVSGSTRSVWDEARSQMTRVNTAITRLAVAEARVEAAGESPEDAALEELADAHAEFYAAGAYDVDKAIALVLAGLGFAASDHDRMCTEFSGGWQMRIALARMLLSAPECLLLDEPTNHLDAAARRWLGEYLSTYDGSVVVVSHDEALLKRACDRVAEVTSAGSLEHFPGNWAYYQREKVARAEAAAAAYEAQQTEIAHLQGFVDRFSAGTRSKQAQSRVKALERIERVAPPPPGALGGAPVGRGPRLNLPPPPPCDPILLRLTGGAAGHDASRPAVTGATLLLETGMRLILLGPNGAGKSTMLRTLAGLLPLRAGTLVRSPGLEANTFTQDLAQDLPQDVTALGHVLDVCRVAEPTLTDERARGVLGALGLSGGKPLQLIGQLSGGEKARVALALFALKPANLLFLDEPSNHLDAATVAMLAQTLREYPGGVILVSHDRPFAEACAPTHVAHVRDGAFTLTGRPLCDADWAMQEAEMTADAPPKAPKAVAAGGPPAKKVAHKGKKVAAPTPAPVAQTSAAAKGGKPGAKPSFGNVERKQYGALEAELAKLGEEQGILESQISNGLTKKEVQQASARLGELGVEIEEKTKTWIALSERASAAGVEL